MKKTLVFALLGLAATFSASAQYGHISPQEAARRNCAGAPSKFEFNRCVQSQLAQRRSDRDRYDRHAYDQREYDRYQGRNRPPAPAYGRGAAPAPRLSDMQQRALDNCVMLAPRDQPRCRATVFSTVR